MALTYGFYDASKHDRRYNAIEMSSIFDGIIEDGVYQSIGTAMIVTANEGMMLKIGIGRAWFDHSWTYNDSEMPILIPQSELVLNRIDTIVLDIDSREEKRVNSIIVVKGNPATNPTAKPLIKNIKHTQYPLARVYVGAEVTEIRAEDITNCVGTSECPFVICPLKTINIDLLVKKWQGQFDTWFENLEYVLSGDVAGKLYVEIQKTKRFATEEIDKMNQELIKRLGGCSLEQEGNNFFIIGADSVRKKLGDVEEGLHFYSSSTNLYIPGRGGSTSGTVPIDLTKYKIKAFYAQLGGISTIIYPNSASGGDALVDCGVTRVSGNINNNTGAWSISVNTNGGESFVSVGYTCVYIDK